MKRLLHSLVACGRNDNVCSHLQFFLPWHLLSGINGGYYPAALQQAHSTTTHEAPHSAMPTSAAQSQAIALPVSAVTTAPPGLAHGLVSKSVSPYALPVVSSVTNLLPRYHFSLWARQTHRITSRQNHRKFIRCSRAKCEGGARQFADKHCIAI